MKKIVTIVVVIVICCMLLVGCTGSCVNDDRFFINHYNDGCTIIVDAETRVMYLSRKAGYGAGLTVMVDADGKPLLYSESDLYYQ